jgi:hypothetical protein
MAANQLSKTGTQINRSTSRQYQLASNPSSKLIIKLLKTTMNSRS